jgi:SagB-type dehydrogenase family enzyme
MAVAIIPLISENSTEFLLVNSDKKKVYQINSIDLIIDYLNPNTRLNKFEFSEFFETNESDKKFDFTEIYKEFVFDYNFFDYNRGYWRDYDNKLMKYYYSYDNDTKQNKIEKINVELSQSHFVDKLLNILEIVFKPFFEIVKEMEVAYLKTSPSGGYRHPTECLLYLKNIENTKDGIYMYNFELDKLIQSDLNIEIDSIYFTKNINIILLSRVEKAMWRYRETRAYRPILIDLGHILQTLELIVSHNGYTYDIDYSISNFIKDIDFNLLPFLNLSFDYTPNLNIKIEKSNQESKTKSADCINPFSFITNSNNQIVLSSLFPNKKELKINFEDFKNIINNKIELPLKNKLIENNFLISKDVLQNRLKNVELYITYNWILSLFNYLNVFSLQDKKYNNQTSILALKNGLIKNLYERRTTRTFKRVPYFNSEKISKFFSNIFKDIQLHTINKLNLFFVLYNYEIKLFELYSYNINDNSIVQISSAHYSENDIAKITIGQGWAGTGELFLWLCTSIAENKEYNISIIDLGRIGQRICLYANDLGLSVCMTPAVNDSQVCAFLNLLESNDKVFYSFNIGSKK